MSSPPSMNKATGAPNGCAGAVWADGTVSEDYCRNEGYAKGRFPWWGKCCGVAKELAGVFGFTLKCVKKCYPKC